MAPSPSWRIFTTVVCSAAIRILFLFSRYLVRIAITAYPAPKMAIAIPAIRGSITKSVEKIDKKRIPDVTRLASDIRTLLAAATF
jgi:uncharacterized membrane protein